MRSESSDASTVRTTRASGTDLRSAVAWVDETAEALIHALSQAFQKRGLPRALLTDNGAAMLAAETIEGLERLGIVHHTTLPYSPEQNGKQESFWGQIEGRLLPMLEGEPELTLELLNRATQAWVEEEYQRKSHSEIHESPLDRYMRGPSVGRECPSSDALRRAFRTDLSRKQRRSEIPLQVAAKAGAIVEDAEQLGFLPLPRRDEHGPRAFVKVQVPEAVHVRDLV